MAVSWINVSAGGRRLFLMEIYDSNLCLKLGSHDIHRITINIKTTKTTIVKCLNCNEILIESKMNLLR